MRAGGRVRAKAKAKAQDARGAREGCAGGSAVVSGCSMVMAPGPMMTCAAEGGKGDAQRHIGTGVFRAATSGGGKSVSRDAFPSRAAIGIRKRAASERERCALRCVAWGDARADGIRDRKRRAAAGEAKKASGEVRSRTDDAPPGGGGGGMTGGGRGENQAGGAIEFGRG